MDTRTREAVRYLGYGKQAIDERTLQLVQECFKELELAADVRFIYRIFELSSAEDDTIQIEHLRIQSQKLSKNLKGCEKIVLFAVTLGTSVDLLMRKYEITNIAKAIVFQAAAAAYLEEWCNRLQKQLEKEQNKEGYYIRPRFSPGYGDFPIQHQKDVLQMLDAPKRIGLTMTDAYMLTPIKSVTAVIGLSRENVRCHQYGCEECTKTDCSYRRNE